jgi:hypothetical protein
VWGLVRRCKSTSDDASKHHSDEVRTGTACQTRKGSNLLTGRAMSRVQGRDSSPAFRTEPENLEGDDKGKVQVEDPRGVPKHRQGALLRVSENGVIPMERREQVTHAERESTGNRRNSWFSAEGGSLLGVARDG